MKELALLTIARADLKLQSRNLKLKQGSKCSRNVNFPNRAVSSQVENEALLEKDQTIGELRETIEILELKIKKLEQLVKLKDTKI